MSGRLRTVLATVAGRAHAVKNFLVLWQASRQIQSTSQEKQLRAVDKFNKMRDPRATELLIGLFDGKRLYSPRKMAAVYLNEMRDPRATKLLIDLLADEDLRVREAVVQALAHLEDHQLFTYYSDPRTFIDRLTHERGPLVADQVEQALGMNVGRVVEGLTIALRDDQSDIRSLAVRGLGYLKDPRAVEALSTALSDSDENVRWLAEKAMSWQQEIQDLDAKPWCDYNPEALITILDDERKSPGVRSKAAIALGQRGSVEAVSSLTAAMRRPQDAEQDLLMFRLACYSALFHISEGSITDNDRKQLVWAVVYKLEQLASRIKTEVKETKVTGVYSHASDYIYLTEEITEVVPDPDNEGIEKLMNAVPEELLQSVLLERQRRKG
jgi:HEAT repeat protein